MIRSGQLKFPRSRQRNYFACGSRSVYAILKYYNFKKQYKLLEAELGTTPEAGTTVKAMQDALSIRGLFVPIYQVVTLRKLTKHLEKGVAILHVDGDHFLVVHARRGKYFYVMDPWGPPDKLTIRVLRRLWEGWAILVSPKSSLQD